MDAFNLYYGAVRGTPFKWLHIGGRGRRRLKPENDVRRIRYFTALVRGWPHDPDQPMRQQIYLRALRTTPGLEVHLGHFLTHVKNLPLAGSGSPPKKASVIVTEEKGSDVNLATYLLHDAHTNDYDAAVVISNDSDLVEAIRIVRDSLKKVVVILNPSRKRGNKELADAASFVRQIRPWAVRASQFPDRMTDATGEFHKPGAWEPGGYTSTRERGS